MYKLLSAVFLILIAAGVLARSFDLSVYKDGYYLRYEFPRFAQEKWFEVSLGKRQGLAGVIDDVKKKPANNCWLFYSAAVYLSTETMDYFLSEPVIELISFETDFLKSSMAEAPSFFTSTR